MTSHLVSRTASSTPSLCKSIPRLLAHLYNTYPIPRHQHANRQSHFGRRSLCTTTVNTTASQYIWQPSWKVFHQVPLRLSQLEDYCKNAKVTVPSEFEYRVSIAGWIRTVRHSKSAIFVVINDGSTQESLQCVVDPTIANATHFTTGSSIALQGKIIVNERAFLKSSSILSLTTVEMQVEQVELIGESPSEYPMAKRAHSLEYLREQLHLRFRTNTIGAITRIRSVAHKSLIDIMNQNGFTLVQTPIVTPLDCEGGGEAFTVTVPGEDKNEPFFKQNAYLGVSGQLYAEMAVGSLTRVYTFGPTFRAEKSHTTRHLAEFWMFEPEMAFVNLKDIMNMSEICVKYCIEQCLRHCENEIKFMQERYDKELLKNLRAIIEKPFVQITYTEAISILEDVISKKKSLFEFPVHWGDPLSSEHEKYLAEVHFKGPVFVTNYPRAVKAFYMKLDDICEDPSKQTVSCFDLLVPKIGELIGGSEREDRIDKLTDQMSFAKLDPELYTWYVDLRKFGSVPHGGYGLGFERLLLLITGMTNIRDVIAVPRSTGTMRF